LSEYETDTIKRIEPVSKNPKPVKRVEFLHKKEHVSVLHHPARRQILHILKGGIDDTITTESFNENTQERLIRQSIVKRHTLSVNEIIRRSNEIGNSEPLTKNQIYHHLPEMAKANLVERYGVLRKGKRTTDFYRRTADNFVTFGLHYEPKRFQNAVRKETEKALPMFGLDLLESERQKFLDLVVQSELMKLEGAKAVENLVSDDIIDPKAVEVLEWLLWVYATGKEEYMRLLNQVREIVFSKQLDVAI
jgi:DNA-binding transcriptional ArsR family regulator